jgi:hypothetical protein
VLGVALALRVLLLGSSLGLSDDHWRYVWEGGLVLEGKSPYAWAPDAPELAAEREAWGEVYGRMNNTAVSAAYPPVTQAAAAGLTALAGGPTEADGAAWAMRLGFGLADLAVLAALALLLERRGLPRGRVLVWAWSPLVAWEFAGAGHFDSLGIALLLLGLLLLERPRPGPGSADRAGPGALVLGAACLAAAFLVKLLPLLAFPFVVRRAGWRAGALLAGLLLLFTVALAAPVLLLEGGSQGLLAGLGEYGLRWESWNLGFGWFEHLFEGFGVRDGSWSDPRRLARLAVAGLMALWALALWLRRAEPLLATGACLAAYLLLTPTLHPWYLTWLLALVAFLPTPFARPWLWLAAATPLLYLPLVGWKSAGVWEQPPWSWPVVAAPFYLLLSAALLHLLRPTLPAEPT